MKTNNVEWKQKQQHGNLQSMKIAPVGEIIIYSNFLLRLERQASVFCWFCSCFWTGDSVGESW